MTALNANEQKVLDAIKQNAIDETGGEFAIVCYGTMRPRKQTKFLEVEGLSPKQVEGYLSQLQQKKIISLYQEDVNRTNYVTQAIIN